MRAPLAGPAPSCGMRLRFQTDSHFGHGFVQITADNAPLVILVKHLVNGATGGTATDRSWVLQALSPPNLILPVSIFGRTGDPDVTERPVDPGTYTLSEEFGRLGYSASSWFSRGAPFSANQVTLDRGDRVTCDITNTVTAPTLTLVKNLNNGDTGASTTPQGWTLSAEGPRLISGTSGSPEVTNVPVAAGTYTLRESGPGAYSRRAGTVSALWSGQRAVPAAGGERDVHDHQHGGGATVDVGETGRRAERWQRDTGRVDADGGGCQCAMPDHRWSRSQNLVRHPSAASGQSHRRPGQGVP